MELKFVHVVLKMIQMYYIYVHNHITCRTGLIKPISPVNHDSIKMVWDNNTQSFGIFQNPLIFR